MVIFGLEDVVFWKIMFYLSSGAILSLYVIFGIRFLRDSRRFEKGAEQREYYLGLGLFIISVAIGEWVYQLDLIYRTFYGLRVFLTLDPGGIGKLQDWQYYAGVEINSLMNRDYYLIIFWMLIISLSFLMKPLEKFILEREKPIITRFIRILIPLPFLLRLFELNFYNWFGIQVVTTSIPYYIITGLWIFIIFILIFCIISLIGIQYKMGFQSPEKQPLSRKKILVLIVFFIGVIPLYFIEPVIALAVTLMFLLIVFILYIRKGLKTPTSSHLKKKSLMIILGIMFWIVAVFLTKTVHDNIKHTGFVVPIIPLLLILALYFMSKGYRPEEYKMDETAKSLPGTFVLSRPPKLTEEEVKFYREQTICLVCKGKLGGYGVFLCYDCKALYCENCAKAIEDLENACWACNSPIAKSKPVKLPDKGVKEVTVEESSVKGIKNKKLEE
jgi:hypothetical protein